MPEGDRVEINVMAMNDAFIAVDWGTTNRRAFRIEAGIAVATERDARGAAAVQADEFPADVAGLRARLGDLPVLMAGMVGSNIGWRAVPYLPVPANLPQLAAGICWIDDRTGIVPGLSYIDGRHGDVMRGEEVQLLGAIAAGLVPADALLCQPGTHCKWATMAGGAVSRFTTAMTGELFALLRQHGLLARQLGGAVVDGPAFAEGLAEGARRDLAVSLFAIRGGGLLGLRPDADAPSFASGLLIGADVAARLQQADGNDVYILADPALGGLYATAVRTFGGRPHLIDSHAAFIAGITHIWELRG